MILPLSPDAMLGIFMMANPIGEGHDGGEEAGDGHSSLNVISQATENGVVHVSTPILVICAFPLLFMAYLGHRFDLGLENTLIIGIIRSFVQLMILGLILHPIFLMGMDWPSLVFLCEYSVLSFLPNRNNDYDAHICLFLTVCSNIICCQQNM